MKNQSSETKVQTVQDLSAGQVSEIVTRSGLSRDELAQKLGCGTSQLFKYEQEGLPPRMNRQVRAAILQLGIDTGSLPNNAVTRSTIAKLSKN